MIFGNLRARGAKYMIGDRPDQLTDREAFSQAMQRAWAAFARTGDPSHPGLPDWPAFDVAHRRTMILDRPCRVENDPRSPIRRVWDELEFDGVHPAVEDLPRIADITRYLAIRGALGLGSAAVVGLILWLLLKTA